MHGLPTVVFPVVALTRSQSLSVAALAQSDGPWHLRSHLELESGFPDESEKIVTGCTFSIKFFHIAVSAQILPDLDDLEQKKIDFLNTLSNF